MDDKSYYIALRLYGSCLEDISFWLNMWGVESIMEEEDHVIAYWPKTVWHSIQDDLSKAIDNRDDLEIRSIMEIEPTNWNAKWEEKFIPIEVDTFCRIRTPFHPDKEGFTHEVFIQPQMSFGTGHHETTFQMIKAIADFDLQGKSVVDCGTGTGILAILARLLGASVVQAFDNDLWSYENAQENMTLNKIDDIEWIYSDISNFQPKQKFEVVLANINKNILLQHVKELATYTAPGGTLLVSGFYKNDFHDIVDGFSSYFTPMTHTERNNWICACFRLHIEQN